MSTGSVAGTFVEIQFPNDISQGATGGPGFSTSITTLSSGFEHRNINWSLARAEYDVAKALQTQVQVETLLDFFNARFGKAIGFRFKDWIDYRLPRWQYTPGDLFALPLLFTTNGSTASFQLTKVYASGLATYARPIVKPVVGTLALLNNGAPTFDYTVDTTTGIVTLGGTTAATTGRLITGSCEFDVPCRFDTDQLKLGITTTEIYSWASIPIVETRDF
jgi:uncharacterized protein (TIGR02217 family)